MNEDIFSPYSHSSTSSSSETSSLEFFKDIPFLGYENPELWTTMEAQKALLYANGTPDTPEQGESSNSPDDSSKNTRVMKHSKKTKEVQRIRGERPTQCAVCQRPASCCHYGVPCCNGCKTFFRRYLKNINELKCAYDGDCNIVAFIGKHYCRACRLKRCLAAGMNPNAVGKDDERIVKAIKKEIIDRDDETPQKSVLELERICTKDTYRPWRQEHINPLKYAEKLVAAFRTISYSDTLLTHYKTDIKTILQKKCELGKTSEKVTYKKIVNSDNAHNPGSHGIGSSGSAFKVADRRHWLTHDLLLSIEQIKTMPWFPDIGIEDQIKIVKNVCLVVTMLTQTYYSHKANQETIVMPDGSTPVQFKPYGSSPTSLEEEVFFRVMEPMKRINITFKEYLLLKSLVFAYYMVPEISEETAKLLKNVWEQYSSMLMRYLQRKHGISGAAERFGKIVALIESFFQFAAKHRVLYTYGKVFSNSNGSQVSNIMEEIMA